MRKRSSATMRGNAAPSESPPLPALENISAAWSYVNHAAHFFCPFPGGSRQQFREQLLRILRIALRKRCIPGQVPLAVCVSAVVICLSEIRIKLDRPVVVRDRLI